ncbi:hypothetical protein AJ80_04977 [Polytolypa hystricis UAMH7299]|uniref:Lariat debranching enzyme C-terminal domain-containing protein n=1 Tax=Polytolypa hystricis (strain UAMH7299) TaxID=1447883 RepID=A0A2B7Y896_POLH7|nr:hypothetical protein AJ80_04977 [Polytolypa hystricis UAMH7299]
MAQPAFRVAVQGCGHGMLHDIYSSVKESAALKGWDGVDLVIIGGDFQAVRNSNDLASMSVPQKYKQIGDFHDYYRGARVAPYLTIFIGGNHEASSHLWELYYGGWVAPNIYYLGAANVIRCGPLRIAGMTGIWKGHDYRKPHFERLPYNSDDTRSIYHIRELDVRKLLQIRSQVDIGLSHDWPQGIEWAGDYNNLFRKKRAFAQDANTGRLGSVAAKYVLDRLRPLFWFSAHLHCKFTASVNHGLYVPASVNQGPYVPTPVRSRAEHGEPAALETAEPQTDTREPATVQSKDNQSEAKMDIDPMEVASKGGEEKKGGQAGVSALPGKTQGQDVASREQLVSAWSNFHEVAAKEDAEELARFQKEQEEHQIKVKAGLATDFSEVSYQETWRKVAVKDDGLSRKVTDVVKTGFEDESAAKEDEIAKEQDMAAPAAVKNADEIDLDSDSSSEAPEPSNPRAVAAEGPKLTKPTDASETKPDQGKEAGTSDDIPEDLRNLLPASFRKPEATDVPADVPVFEATLPAGITNTTTKFLALDKCGSGRQFLQLLEFPATSSSDSSAEDQHPYQLKYDKEWLAITRVFANDLILGDPDAPIPHNKGDAIYKPMIEEAEQWVEENISSKGKMVVPENFSITAPIYDPAVPIDTNQQPQEYTNPQTTQFCELLGIENKFHASDEDRQARNAAGPRPASERNNNFGGHGQGRRGHQGRGGRGGGRGRGRGGNYRGGQRNDNSFFQGGGGGGGRGGYGGGNKNRGFHNQSQGGGYGGPGNMYAGLPAHDQFASGFY